ncbi:MAG: TetR family transcriptional regulator C-terminal domain-containing protein [Planctomycetota bacterium]
MALAAASPTESLRRFFEYALDKHRRKRFVGGCLFGNTALEMSDADSRYADCVTEVFRQWTEKIEAVIQAGQKTGEFRADIPADQLAQMIVSTVEGGIMMSRLRKQEEPLNACVESMKTLVGATIAQERHTLSP